MRKQILLLTGASLLLGLGSYAQSVDPDAPMWKMGFEAGMEMFNEDDEASVAGTIDTLYYYGGLTASQETASDNKGNFALDTVPVVGLDTTIYMQHAISTVSQKRNQYGQTQEGFWYDTATVETYAEIDPDGLSELAALGVDVSQNTKFFRWGSELNRDEVPDYNSNLFVRGLPIEPKTSYRLTFYMKADTTNAFVDVRLLRGWYDSEKPFTTQEDQDGADYAFIGEARGSAWVDEITGKADPLKLNHWQRYTFMYYYDNDSIENALCQHKYYWGSQDETHKWYPIFRDLRYKLTDEQKKLFTKTVKKTDPETGEEYDYDSVWATRIVQPDQFFLRFAFRGGSTVYYVDDIALYKSNIGAAEVSGDIIRLNFGYKTNIDKLCKVSPLGRIAMPDDMISEVFTLTMKDQKGADKQALEIVHAEYQSDGMVYLWLEDSPAEGDQLWVSFNNPEAAEFQLKYADAHLYPYFSDKDWVDAGKVIPDFEKEKILVSGFAAVPTVDDVPPTILSAEPVQQSFNLGAADKQFVFKFTRLVYTGKDVDEPLAVRIVDTDEKSGFAPVLLDAKFNAADSTMTVTIPDGTVATLDGIYNIIFANLRSYYVEDGETYYSDFTYEDINSGQSLNVEYTWGDKFKGNEKTTEGYYYKKVKDSYDAAYKYAYDETLMETKALISFKVFLADYEPDLFLSKHKNPADYDVAKKAIDDKLAELKTVMEIAGKLQSTLADARARLDFMGKFANIASNEKYTKFKSDYDNFSGKSYADKESEEILSDYNQLFDDINNLESVTDMVLQANELYELCKTLGVAFSADNEAFIEEQIKLTGYNENLVAKLKLEAIRAIYVTLNKGENIDSVDVSGFIENPSFYTSAMLDVDVEKYNAQYHTETTESAYRIKLDAPYSTVYPGWTIQTSVTSGWGGPNPYGVWNDPRDGWFKIKGVYVEKEGQITAGAIGADWGSAFNIKQEIADLPEGTYTICIPSIVPNPSNPGNKLLDKIIIGTDTIESDAYMNAVGTMTAPLTAGDALHIEYDHDKYTEGKSMWGSQNEFQNGCFVNNVLLYLVAESAGAGKYAEQIAAIEGKITAIEEVEAADTKAIYYNMNGVRVNALRKGEMGIRVDAKGNAQKVVNFE